MPPETRLRLGTWNVEWMNALFDDAGRLREDDGPSARYGISRRDQLAAIGVVLAAMDPDALVVVEAPDTNGRRSTVRALETLAAACDLRARSALIGYPSETEQEIALLYDPDRITARHDPKGEPAPRHGGAARFVCVFRLVIYNDTNSRPLFWS